MAKPSFHHWRHFWFTAGCVTSVGAGLAYMRHKNIVESQKIAIRLRDLNPFATKETSIFKEKSVMLPSILNNVAEMIRINWTTASPGQKVVWGIIGVNSLVFLGWRLPFAQAFMNKHFVHHPTANRPYTLLTCVFSHQQLAHFAFNMMALNSLYTFYQNSNFISSEQTLAFYLSAGLY